MFDLFEKGSDSHEEFASGAGYERSSADEVHSNLSRIIEKSKQRHVELLTEKQKRAARRHAASPSSRSSRSRSKSKSIEGDEKSSSSSDDVEKASKLKSPETLPQVSLDDLAKTSDTRPTKAIVITRDDDEDDRRRNGGGYNHYHHSSNNNNRYTYTNNGARGNNYERFGI